MKWTSIRVDVDSARRLEDYRSRLENAIKRHVAEHPTEPGTTRVSLGQALIALLAGKEAHQARGRKQSEKRRKRTPADTSAADIASLHEMY